MMTGVSEARSICASVDGMKRRSNKVQDSIATFDEIEKSNTDELLIGRTMDTNLSETTEAVQCCFEFVNGSCPKATRSNGLRL
ncbi:hypothetical protein scyTo_0020085 [Scyliorhinus torazame]|uniref:Uncharacterized protein n=1 Tax=Scyliorhinus torazame TaxID=75743 RepID=A0A401PYR2_SCYTO|nr:hypothetical protein [Scyliorhinus torazame]